MSGNPGGYMIIPETLTLCSGVSFEEKDYVNNSRERSGQCTTGCLAG
jgi:hypothetical protein